MHPIGACDSSENDKKLAAAIDRIGMIEREVNKDLFSALIGSIVSLYLWELSKEEKAE